MWILYLLILRTYCFNKSIDFLLGPKGWIGYLRFYVPLKIFFTYKETSPLPVILGLCSVFRAFEQGGIFYIFILATPAVTRGLIFPVLIRKSPHLVASYDTRGDAEDVF
jgi:hypothetical protein